MGENERQALLNETRNALERAYRNMHKIASDDERTHAAKGGSMRTRDRVGVCRLEYAAQLKGMAQIVRSMKI